MKQQIIRYLLSIGVACSISTSFEQTVRAEGESCDIGWIGITADPSRLTINAPENACDPGEKLLGTLVLRVTGNEPILMYGVDITPHTPADNVFMSLDTEKHMSVQMETSDTWQFTFTPRSSGLYNATVTYTFGYGNHTLSNHKTCITQYYDGVLSAKKKAVAEMDAVGPDYRMVDQRIRTENDSYQKAKSDLESDIRRDKAEVARLEEEKEKALEEMRRGEFCSTCNGTRSEFEKRGEDFDQHIREGASEGRHVRPAKPEELEKKARQFDDKIRPLKERVETAEQKLPGLKDRHELIIKRFEEQRIVLKTLFDERLQKLRLQVKDVEQRYADAMRKHSDLEKVRKTITSQLGGTCHVKQ